MATTLETPFEILQPAKPTGPATWPRAAWKFVRRKPLGAVGGFIIVLMVVAAVFVDGALVGQDEPILAISGYNDQNLHKGERDQIWSLDHPMGTDEFGRDIFSRILYGARISIVIGLCTVLFAAAVSLLLGTVSGYFGSWIDALTQRAVDVVLAIPPIILLLFSLSVFAGRAGPYTRMFWIILIVGIIISAASARVVRSATIAIANNQYVDAARTIGASDARIIVQHIVPNVIPVVIVLSTVQLGTAILAEATISFLGLGIPNPFPSWGAMLSLSGIANFRAHPEQAIWPGLAIALAVYGFNMFGDALRDVLDPRLRGGR